MRASLRALGALGFVAVLAGCSGYGTTLQPGAAPPNASAASHGPAARSWMLPEAKNNDLLYVSDLLAQVVYIYTYRGHKLVGTLTGFFNPEGLCVDKAGDVYVTNDTSEGVHQITEYAHGATTPLRTLNDPQGRANGCSVDPKTGDLAVANFWDRPRASATSRSTGTPLERPPLIRIQTSGTTTTARTITREISSLTARRRAASSAWAR